MGIMYIGNKPASIITTPTDLRNAGYKVTFNNKAHQQITAELEPTWKTTTYTDSFQAGPLNIDVKLHLYAHSTDAGYAHGQLSWNPSSFINGGILTSDLVVNVTDATPIEDVIIPTGYQDYYLHNGISKFYEDTNYDTYVTKSDISGKVILFDLNNYLSNSYSLYGLFDRSYDIEELDLTNLNTSNITGISYLCRDCKNMTLVNLTNFDTTNVVNMGSMFGGCDSLISLDLSNFNTSKVTNFDFMFSGLNNLEVLDLSNFDTSINPTMNSFMELPSLRYLIISSPIYQFKLTQVSDRYFPSTCKILVPQALISTYQTATNWSRFASQFDAIENYTITRSNGQVTVTPNS